jgi:HEAT repeat protein
VETRQEEPLRVEVQDTAAIANLKTASFWTRLLASPDESERVRATWALIWHKDRDEAVARIPDLLSNGSGASPDLRYLLITLMSKIGSEKFSRTLKEKLTHSILDRHEATAVEDLLVSDDRDGLDVVLSTLAGKKSRWAMQLETSILRRMDLPIHKLHELLASEQLGIRAATTIVLGSRSDRTSTSLLQIALHDTDREVRMAAVSSLGLIGERSSTESLRRMLKGQHVSIRRKTIQALSRIDDPEALKAICNCAIEGGNMDVRREAVRVLEGRPGQAVEDTLIAAMNDQSVKARIAALRALVKRSKASVTKGIAMARDSEEEELRREAQYWEEKHNSKTYPLYWSLNNI